MDLQEAIVTLPALIMAVILHEYAHGWMAYRMGDPTAKELGRLTLNPVPHIDPLGTLLLPGLLMLAGSPVLFGWAKPVPVNPVHFKNLRLGTFLVSVAGILMNLWLALIFSSVYRLILQGYLNPLGEAVLLPLALFSAKAVLINLVLAFLNAIPIPPLDGGRALMSFFSVRHWELFYRFEIYGFIIITVLLFTGLLGQVIFPPVFFLWNYLIGRL